MNRPDKCPIHDNPIWKPEDDTIGRVDVARSFVEQVVSLDVTQGVVVGIFGPWGSGKTSFINLARLYLKDASIAIIDFNPWMFSGTEQLVKSFFIEIARQLKLRNSLAKIGKDLETYGDTLSGMGWLPIIGTWIERGRVAIKIVAKFFQKRKEGEGVNEIRTKVERALATLQKPIIVVLDDIDRLTSFEIRDIFKLVRLIANFPNIIYVLAFDRIRVENALTEQGIHGRDYLEKILQVGIDLPVVPVYLLNKQVFKAIDDVLAIIENKGPFDKNVWPDVFIEVIQPLIRNMRDVRRYAAAIFCTVQALAGRIALVDVLALEAVRVFMPDVFNRLHESIEGLTTTDLTYITRRDPPYLKEQIDRLINAAGDHSNIVRAMIQHLFPGGQRHIGGPTYGSDSKNRWIRGRRVAHEEILRLYLERTIGEGLQTFSDAEQAWIRMSDRVAFEDYLRSISIERLQDVISSLENYEDQFSVRHVVPGTIVLLNLLPELPERKRGMFELSTRMVVGRVIYRLVRSLKDTQLIEAAVREILPQLTTLSSKAELIIDIGYQEGAGHKLVSESEAKKFEQDWYKEVLSASINVLAAEKDLLKVMLFAKRIVDPVGQQINVDASPCITLTLLKSARSEVRSQTIGSHAVRRFDRLAWQALIKVYGTEDTLRTRIEELKNTKPKDIDDLLELADEYLEGRRHDEIVDD